MALSILQTDIQQHEHYCTWCNSRITCSDPRCDSNDDPKQYHIRGCDGPGCQGRQR